MAVKEQLEIPEEQERRKARSEERLQSHGILINKHLPLFPKSSEVHWRTVRTTAGRALALSYIILTAFDAVEAQWVLSDLEQFGLAHLITPSEIVFLKEPAEGRKRTLTWRSEALWTLLWALGVVDELGFPNSMIQLGDIPAGEFPISPDENPDQYLERFTELRSADELMDELDFYYRALWSCRNGALYLEKNSPINAAIVFERYLALNWLRCYHNKDWDHISTET